VQKTSLPHFDVCVRAKEGGDSAPQVAPSEPQCVRFAIVPEYPPSVVTLPEFADDLLQFEAEEFAVGASRVL
jgi:hypothetical protein